MSFSSSSITNVLWEQIAEVAFIFGRHSEATTRYLYYLMSEYVALLILAMTAGFTVAADSRFDAGFYCWNEFNQMRFTFRYVGNSGASLGFHIWTP